MRNESTGSKCVKISEDEDKEKKMIDSKRHNQVESDILLDSGMRTNSLKLPKCKMSRGLLLAFVFFFLFGVLIIWFIFSNESIDDNMESKWYNKQYAKNNSLDSPLNFDYTLSNDKLNLSNKLFVLFTTVFIVLAIISFVFIGALVHYFQKPKYYGSGSRSQSIVSSIFSHHNHHNNLYYLDREILKEEEIKKKQKKRTKKNSLMPGEREEKNQMVPVERNLITTPTIIIETETL